MLKITNDIRSGKLCSPESRSGAFRAPYTKKLERINMWHSQNAATKGISLIALIITIVVLIILAAVTIFSGLNTPSQAGLAKFATEISDVETAVMEKYHDAESQGIIQGKVKSPEQIYYCIANNTPISNAPANPTKTGDVSSLGVLQPESLNGTVYYQIHNTDLIPANKTFYGDNETQYITNAGEVFILPGYKLKSGNETRWYIDEKRYYVGEGAVDNANAEQNSTNGTIQLSAQIIDTESRAVLIKVTQNGTQPTTSELQNGKTEEELQNMFVVACQTIGTPYTTWSEYLSGMGLSSNATLSDAYASVPSEYTGGAETVYDFIIQTGAYLDTITFNLAGYDSIIGREAEFSITTEGNYTITATDDTNNGSITVSVDSSRCVNRKDNQPETFSSICSVNTNLKAASGGVAPAGNGDTVVAVCPAGFAYGTSSNVGTVANGLVITDSVDSNGRSNGNEFVWIPVDKTNLTAGTTNYTMAEISSGTNYRGVLYNFNSGTSDKITYYSDGYREPAYLTDSTYADASSYNTIGITQNILQEAYDDMITSIQAYGGFYVGRYEMGQDNGNYSKLGITPASAYDGCTNDETGEGALKWYGLYQKAKSYNKTSVVAEMIWGSQFDAMLNFALEGNDSSKVSAHTNGNHSGKMTKTGCWIGSDSINNIFDLEGNQWEWIQEANSTNLRVLRGSTWRLLDICILASRVRHVSSLLLGCCHGLSSRIIYKMNMRGIFKDLE